jgi:glucosylceramidase
LEWNLAGDPNFDPHTPGGCSQCKGALTIDGQSVTRNVSYYIIAHASKFVPPGSVRIESNQLAELPNVAFRTPAGKIVAIVLNERAQTQKFNIRCQERIIKTSLSPGAVGTFEWKE